MNVKMTRRRLVTTFGVVAAGLALGSAMIAPPVAAQDWPAAKPIRLVVPYAPGGGTDIFARQLGTRLSQRLGQQVVVDNRPGAGTAIGAQEVARSAPDGYTWLLGDLATFSVNPSLYKKLAYNPARDYAPISLTGRFSLLLAVNPTALKVNTLSQLVESLKQRPGEIAYGTPGVGSPHHLAMELLAQRTGTKLLHVPYKGSSPALSDLLGGRVPMMFINLATAGPHLKTGALKVLAVSGDKRIAALPDVPTIAEAGVPGYEVWGWQGMVAPAGTPQAVLERLRSEYLKLVNDSSFLRMMTDEAGMEPMYSTGTEMADYMNAEAAKWALVIKQSGITAD